MQSLRQDVHYAIRTLLDSPGVTFVALLSLALGIGATTAIFSVVKGVLLEPLPYRAPESLVMVWEHNYPEGEKENVVSPANFIAWSEQATAFEGLAALREFSATLTGAGEPERVGVVAASASLFPVLGIQPTLGRAYTEAEDVEGADDVALISHGFWQRRFDGDPAVMGRTLTLNGSNRVIVGVLPQGFRFDLPVNLGEIDSQDVWVPQQFGVEAREWRGRSLQVVGRLKPGFTTREAQDSMSVLGRQLEQAFPERQTGWGINVVPLHQQVVGDVRTALWIILGAVTFVLLIACANVANLLIARAARRQREFAMRAALGARRGRIIRQLLTESVMLSLTGGLLGLCGAWAAVRGLVLLAPDIPRLTDVDIDTVVLAFGLGAALLTGLLFGVFPALRGSNVDLVSALKEGGARGGEGVRQQRARAGLVVAEIGLSLVLLVGAGLLIRSFGNLLDVDVGFETEQLLLADVQLPSSSYAEASRRAAFFEHLVGRVEALPGVRSVAAITFPPLSGAGSATSFWANDRPVPAEGEMPGANIRWAVGDYPRTLGIPLLAGRWFDDRDTENSPLSVVISRHTAETFWPDESAIGKSISMRWGEALVADVIGVVDDVRHEGPISELRPMLYWHPAQFQSFDFMTIVARTYTDPLSLVDAVRAEVQAMDADLPIYNVRTMESEISGTLARARFAMMALGLFALVALILAAIGIYGVLSYNVGQRVQELGIRVVVGADRGDVLRLILRQALQLVGIALVLGGAGALALSRLMQGLAFEVGTSDPLTFVASGLVLTTVALLAAGLPAYRATRIEPMQALRDE